MRSLARRALHGRIPRVWSAETRRAPAGEAAALAVATRDRIVPGEFRNVDDGGYVEEWRC